MTCSADIRSPSLSALFLGLEVMAHHRRQGGAVDTHRVTPQSWSTTGKVGQQRCLHMEPQGWSLQFSQRPEGAAGPGWGLCLQGLPTEESSQRVNEAGLDPSSSGPLSLPFIQHNLHPFLLLRNAARPT